MPAVTAAPPAATRRSRQRRVAVPTASRRRLAPAPPAEEAGVEPLREALAGAATASRDARDLLVKPSGLVRLLPDLHKIVGWLAHDACIACHFSATCSPLLRANCAASASTPSSLRSRAAASAEACSHAPVHVPHASAPSQRDRFRLEVEDAQRRIIYGSWSCIASCNASRAAVSRVFFCTLAGGPPVRWFIIFFVRDHVLGSRATFDGA